MLEIYRLILNELTQKRVVSLRSLHDKREDAQSMAAAMETLCDMGYVKILSGAKRCKLTLSRNLMKEFSQRNAKTVYGKTAVIAVGRAAYGILTEAAGINDTDAYFAYFMEQEGIPLFDIVGNYHYAGDKVCERSITTIPKSVEKVYVMGSFFDPFFLSVIKKLKKRFSKNVAALILEEHEEKEEKSEFQKIEEEAGVLLYFAEQNVSYAKLTENLMVGISETQTMAKSRKYRLAVGYWLCEFLRQEKNGFDRFSLFKNGAVYVGMSISDEPTEAVIESIACILKSEELRISPLGSVLSYTQNGTKKIKNLYMKISFGSEFSKIEVEASLERASVLMSAKENFVCEMNPCESKVVSVVTVAS